MNLADGLQSTLARHQHHRVTFLAQYWRVHQTGCLDTADQVLQRLRVKFLALTLGFDDDFGQFYQSHGCFLGLVLVGENGARECLVHGANRAFDALKIGGNGIVCPRGFLAIIARGRYSI